MFRNTLVFRLTAAHKELLPRIRNIGISAHIDSGKTTLSERILFYTGKIKAIHEVKGGDDVGATMDSMELEKERGITIRSAATHCKWKNNHINLIDTPGHVDFTIEVERALRVLDGAVLVICAVGGVQSQTLTVDRQMRRYGVPRIIFINKMDRDNASPAKATKALQERLGIQCAPLQVPIGVAHEFEGIIDIIEQKAVYFDGKHGEKIRMTSEIPSHLVQDVEAARAELFQRLANVDSQMEDIFLNEKQPTPQEFYDAIRRTVIANKFVPVLLGSAYKNKGVQLLLDAVERYLPCPTERRNQCNVFAEEKGEDGVVRTKTGEVTLETDDEKPLVSLAFKLEETREVGLSNYIRVYQGRMRKGDSVMNVRTGHTFTVSKLVRMHANRAENVDEIKCGEICSLIGDVNLSSGDTIVRNLPKEAAGYVGNYILENMYIPPPVMSFTVKAKQSVEQRMLEDRLKGFAREDPTLHMKHNQETRELVVEGMGELHLEIYFERLRREHNIETVVGKPAVNYREIIQKRETFDYVFKRQSGGAGQFAHVKGFIEPLEIDYTTENGVKNRVVLKCPNSEVRENLQKSFAKQFEGKIFSQGPLCNAPIWGMKVQLEGGSMHDVDSNDVAFRNAAQAVFDEFFPKCEPTLLEPWMFVEISVPGHCFSDVLNEFTKRTGVVIDSNVTQIEAVITGDAPLDKMFGFITSLRSLTKGMGTFSMEFKNYRPMTNHSAQEAMNARNKELNRTAPFTL